MKSDAPRCISVNPEDAILGKLTLFGAQNTLELTNRQRIGWLPSQNTVTQYLERLENNGLIHRLNCYPPRPLGDSPIWEITAKGRAIEVIRDIKQRMSWRRQDKRFAPERRISMRKNQAAEICSVLEALTGCGPK